MLEVLSVAMIAELASQPHGARARTAGAASPLAELKVMRG
jgi:hypothetical protein